MKKIAQRIKRTLEERRKCRVVLDPGSGEPEYFGKKFPMDRDEAEELAEEIYDRETTEARRRWRNGSWAGEIVRSRRLPIERCNIFVESRAEHERTLRRIGRRRLLRDLRSSWRRWTLRRR